MNAPDSILLDQLAADGSRLRDLFAALAVLLEGECKPAAIHVARGIALEARALVASVAEQAEGLAARGAEAARQAAV